MFQVPKELQERLTLSQIKREESLSGQAQKSFSSKGRIFPEEEDFRSLFMRDRDRIIHCTSFRRMKDKTQVFLLSPNDMFRNRLTHTLEVSQIARTIAIALNLNENLTEAIALGHDLGHTPFGHMGERALDQLCKIWFHQSGQDYHEVGIEQFLTSGQEWVFTPLKGFRHNIQSLRVVDFLENKGQGLNLSYEVRDGILKHSKWGKGILPGDPQYLPCTLEGQIVRISDRIAYVNHDLDDALRHKLLSVETIPTYFFDILGKSHSERIGKAIISVIEFYEKHAQISMDKALGTCIDELYAFLGTHVYATPAMKKDEEKVQFLVHELAAFYDANPEVILEKTNDIHYPEKVTVREKIINHLANMTDHFLLQEFKRCRIPENWVRI